MVGAPASGKTTLAKRLATESNAGYVSRDEVRYAITKSRKIDMEKEKYVLEKFCELIISYLNDKDIVFADATHSSVRSRFAFLHGIYTEAEKHKIDIHNIKIIPMIIQIPFETCLQRNAARPEEFRAPDEDMINYYSKCSYPSEFELGIEKCFPLRYFYNPETDSFKCVGFMDNVD